MNVVFDEDFGGVPAVDRWCRTRSSAYAYETMNPGDNKLDVISPAAVTCAAGRCALTARPGAAPLPETGRPGWTTGLLTTEYTAQGFEVRTGDQLEARLRLPSAIGAWPALWTWKDGGAEVDVFEYHPDNPYLLELTNHVGGTGTYVDGVVRPGAWHTFGAHFGRDAVTWYLDGRLLWADSAGVGPSWSAYIILNLSVSAGAFHPAPASPAPFSLLADRLYVRR